jgi:hypothetical protein
MTATLTSSDADALGAVTTGITPEIQIEIMQLTRKRFFIE